jgi:hypothetical protein
MKTAPTARFQGYAPSRDGRLGEAGPWLSPVPLEELVQAEVVHTLRNRGGDGIEEKGLQPAPIRALVNYGYLVHLEPLNGQYRQPFGRYLGSGQTSTGIRNRLIKISLGTI